MRKLTIAISSIVLSFIWVVLLYVFGGHFQSTVSGYVVDIINLLFLIFIILSFVVVLVSLKHKEIVWLSMIRQVLTIIFFSAIGVVVILTVILFIDPPQGIGMISRIGI